MMGVMTFALAFAIVGQTSGGHETIHQRIERLNNEVKQCRYLIQSYEKDLAKLQQKIRQVQGETRDNGSKGEQRIGYTESFRSEVAAHRELVQGAILSANDLIACRQQMNAVAGQLAYRWDDVAGVFDRLSKAYLVARDEESYEEIREDYADLAASWSNWATHSRTRAQEVRTEWNEADQIFPFMERRVVLLQHVDDSLASLPPKPNEQEYLANVKRVQKHIAVDEQVRAQTRAWRQSGPLFGGGNGSTPESSSSSEGSLLSRGDAIIDQRRLRQRPLVSIVPASSMASKE